MNAELIERFFHKQCTAEEASEVAAYLKTHPSVLEEYLSLHEWSSVAVDDTMPDAFWDEVWQNIQKKKRSKFILLKLKKVAVAAGFILFIGFLYYLSSSTKETKKTPFASVNKLPFHQQKIITNYTEKLMRVVLEDGSVVELSPAASIKYDPLFSNNKRDITLVGEAKFHESKNKLKPFTVYAGSLAITALGTVFSVKKAVTGNVFSIKLFEGKVLVHSTENNLKGWDKDVYLLPGQQLRFNEALAMLAIEKMSTGKPAIAVKPIKQPTDSAGNQLTFSNTLLPQVMDKLASYYNIKISYDTLLISKMNFTGIVSKSDSAENILKAIGQMNGFDILNNGDEFIISKHE